MIKKHRNKKYRICVYIYMYSANWAVCSTPNPLSPDILGARALSSRAHSTHGLRESVLDKIKKL